VEAERVAVLTEAVDVRVRGKLSTQADVLLLENQRNSDGIKENLIVVPTLDSEGERVLLDPEDESGLAAVGLVVLGAGESLFLNLEDLEVGVVDLDVKTLVCTKLV
jgi:hypothetical protein